MNIREKCFEMIKYLSDNPKREKPSIIKNKLYKIHSEISFEEVKKDKELSSNLIKIMSKYRKENSILNFMSTKNKVLDFDDALWSLIPISIMLLVLSLPLTFFVKSPIMFCFHLWLAIAPIPPLIAGVGVLLKNKYEKVVRIQIDKVNHKDVLDKIIDTNMLLISELEKIEAEPDNKKFYKETVSIKNFIIDHTFDLKSKNSLLYAQNVIENYLLNLTYKKAKKDLDNTIDAKLITEIPKEDPINLIPTDSYKIELTAKDKLEMLKKVLT